MPSTAGPWRVIDFGQPTKSRDEYVAVRVQAHVERNLVCDVGGGGNTAKHLEPLALNDQHLPSRCIEACGIEAALLTPTAQKKVVDFAVTYEGAQ